MSAVVIRGDARHLPLPDESVDLICTSPPYFGLRSYVDGGVHFESQIGSEATPGEWVAALVECTAEWVRVLKPSGSIFVNLGDKYAQDTERHRKGLDSQVACGRSEAMTRGRTIEFGRLDNGGAQRKSLLGLPWRYALACMDELGLILRRDIIWSKPNSLPESVQDRCRSSHEYLFHLTKLPRYYAAVDEIREPHTGPSPEHYGRINYERAADPAGMARTKAPAPPGTAREYNPLGKLPGSVWEIASQPLSVPAHLGVDHFAAFPMELPRRVILGWSPPGVCTACGEGRRPVTDKALDLDHVQRQFRPGFIDGAEPNGNLRGLNAAVRPNGRTVATITGYACGCPDATAPVRPALVVDPFGGTGTTALVASMLGRTGVSVDLSADYCRLARWRTRDPGERARALQVPKPPPVPDGQVSLFDDLPA